MQGLLHVRVSVYAIKIEGAVFVYAADILHGNGNFVEKAYAADGVIVDGELDDLVCKACALGRVGLDLKLSDKFVCLIALKACRGPVAAGTKHGIDEIVRVAVLVGYHAVESNVIVAGENVGRVCVLLRGEGGADANGLELLLNEKRQRVERAGRIVAYVEIEILSVLLIDAVRAESVSGFFNCGLCCGRVNGGLCDLAVSR